MLLKRAFKTVWEQLAKDGKVAAVDGKEFTRAWEDFIREYFWLSNHEFIMRQASLSRASAPIRHIIDYFRGDTPPRDY